LIEPDDRHFGSAGHFHYRFPRAAADRRTAGTHLPHHQAIHAGNGEGGGEPGAVLRHQGAGSGLSRGQIALVRGEIRSPAWNRPWRSILATAPTIKRAVETMPSLAPSSAAFNHPMRSTRWLPTKPVAPVTSDRPSESAIELQAPEQDWSRRIASDDSKDSTVRARCSEFKLQLARREQQPKGRTQNKCHEPPSPFVLRRRAHSSMLSRMNSPRSSCTTRMHTATNSPA